MDVEPPISSDESEQPILNAWIARASASGRRRASFPSERLLSFSAEILSCTSDR